MLRLLDLFCGAGGAAMGYARAGFLVTGVDIKPQPNYPFGFIQADAMSFPLDGFDIIHASPPCQAYSVATWSQTRSGHPDLVPWVRQRIADAGLPYIMENVPRAPLLDPVQLCGSSFGLRVRRHRLFESNLSLTVPPCDHKWQDDDPIYEVHNHREIIRTGVAYVFGNGGKKANEHWAKAMGIPWMTRKELAESIPPAYTEHLGRQAYDQLGDRPALAHAGVHCR